MHHFVSGASHSDSSNPQPSVSEFHSQAEIASRPSFAAEVADSPPTLSSIMVCVRLCGKVRYCNVCFGYALVFFLYTEHLQMLACLNLVP